MNLIRFVRIPTVAAFPALLWCLLAVSSGRPFSPPCLSQEPAPFELHVSHAGNDRWSGQRSRPAPDGTDGPLATLDGALRALAQRRAAGEPRACSIILHAGWYALASAAVVTPVITGDRPLTIRPSRGDTVVLTGSAVTGPFTPLLDSTVRARLSPAARAHVQVTDLRAAGITDFGTVQQMGSPGLEVFFRGIRMPLARFPNEGWLNIVDVPQDDGEPLNPGLARERRFHDVPAGRHFGRFVYPGNRPSAWTPDDSILVHGYWTFDWSDSYQRVARLDTVRREVTLAAPHHHYGYTTNQRFAFLNVFEELDRPGEWFLDRRDGMLYFWPPETLRPGDVRVTTLSAPLLELRGTRDVLVERLVFSQSRGKGIELRRCMSSTVAGCTFDGLGDEAVTVDGGSGNTVRSCTMSALALSCITVRGGDRPTLSPGGHTIVNNHLHHFSRWMRTGRYGIFVDGVGHLVAHNLIHDTPFEALYVRGNDHCIEYNEIHRVTQETGDAGALHTGRDWTWRGTIIRYNYFHDLQGPGLHGVMGVYLDDWASGFTVTGNLFVRAGRATLIGGGRDNRVENNLYIACSPSLHVDARGRSWASYYFDGSRTELRDKMDAMNAAEPPYSLRYPQLVTLYDDEPTIPKGNVVARNVSIGGRWLDVYDYHAFPLTVVKFLNNVVCDSAVFRRRSDGETGWDPYYLNIDGREGYTLSTQSDPKLKTLFPGTLFTPDAGLTAPFDGDYSLVPGGAASRAGFVPLPVELMGLETDEYRTVLPGTNNTR